MASDPTDLDKLALIADCLVEILLNRCKINKTYARDDQLNVVKQLRSNVVTLFKKREATLIIP